MDLFFKYHSLSIGKDLSLMREKDPLPNVRKSETTLLFDQSSLPKTEQFFRDFQQIFSPILLPYQNFNHFSSKWTISDFQNLKDKRSLPNFASNHCVKSVQIRSFFWSLFSCIRTEYEDLLRIQSKYRKIRTRKNSARGHFSSSEYYVNLNKMINYHSPWNH